MKKILFLSMAALLFAASSFAAPQQKHKHHHKHHKHHKEMHHAMKH